MIRKIIINRAAEINKLHNEVCEELRMTVQKAIHIGELLVEQKRECRHGDWLPWLEANVKFTIHTANKYMRLYRRQNKLDFSSNLSLGITDAYKIAGIISKPSKEELEEEEGEREKSTQQKVYEMLAKVAEEGIKELKNRKKVVDIDVESESEPADNSNGEEEFQVVKSDKEIQEQIDKIKEDVELLIDSHLEAKKVEQEDMSLIRKVADKSWKALSEGYDSEHKVMLARALVEKLRKRYRL